MIKVITGIKSIAATMTNIMIFPHIVFAGDLNVGIAFGFGLSFVFLMGFSFLFINFTSIKTLYHNKKIFKGKNE